MCAEGSPVVLEHRGGIHARAILKVPSLAGIVILASGRPAPVLLRTRRQIPPVLPYTPRLMRLFSFPRVFDFSIFSFSRPSPADRPLATRNFSPAFSPAPAWPDPERLQRLVTFPPAVRPPTVSLSCFSEVVVPALTATFFSRFSEPFRLPFFPDIRPVRKCRTVSARFSSPFSPSFCPLHLF